MDGIFSIIDLAHLGLSLERVKVGVAAENIANIHNASYLPKVINKQEFKSLLNGDKVFRHEGGLSELDMKGVVDADTFSSINLDEEVLRVTDAEIRYQAITQMLQKKFGLLELSMGVKK